MNSKIIVGGLVALVLVGGTYFISQKKTPHTAVVAQEQSALIEREAALKDEAMHKEEMMRKEVANSAMKKEDGAMMKKDAPVVADHMMTSGSYIAYAPEKIATAAATGNVVLFFHASWCPTCRAVDADIRAHLSAIPKNLTILDVDYDNSAALKQKYGVTYQHTFVEVDAKGTLIKKWSGSPTLAAIVAEVK